MKFCIIGNPVDGFRLVGPFETWEDVDAWSEGCNESHWGIESVPPD